MSRNVSPWRAGWIVAVAVLALSTACDDNAGLGPDRSAGSNLDSGLAFAQLASVATGLVPSGGMRVPDLTACPRLQITDPSIVAFSVYASGFQVYTWNGTSWVFATPDATLFADEGRQGQVGTHYSGPTWESSSGGKVVGSVLERCTVDPTAVPWLLLSAVSDGPGVFQHVTYIQRVNTVGGNAPSSPGSVPGDMAKVPYTADYIFYRPL